MNDFFHLGRIFLLSFLGGIGSSPIEGPTSNPIQLLLSAAVYLVVWFISSPRSLRFGLGPYSF